MLAVLGSGDTVFTFATGLIFLNFSYKKPRLMRSAAVPPLYDTFVLGKCSLVHYKYRG